MRSLGITLLSLALTTIVVANAYYQKKQFYPSVVYITKSNPSMAVIYIQAFICVLLAGKLMRKIFFGQLRTSEFEHLMERSWYAITETCLAFTVFRDDFNPKFVALFTLLLFLKSFHWLAEDRVDYMERSPVISWLFHFRVVSLLFVLGLLDAYFVEHAYYSTVTNGASVQLVFGFEYAILLAMIVNISIKYILYTIDINSETPWDNKAVFLLYTELIMGLIKVLLYITFVVIMVKIYTLPLFALRPMYYTVRNFKKAFNDVILSRRAIHNMLLYPDATPEELQMGDNVCIICREEMTTASKKLPCNHIFHVSCLRSWFQRQQTCPTCRLNILQSAPNNNEPVRPERPRQQPPAQPNQFFPFIAANPFQMLNPNAQNVPQQPQQNVPMAQTPTPQNAPTNNNNNNNNNTPPPNIPNMPPFPLPPFPFMTLFPTPPPMPPPDLSNLTVEQLRRLEGNERENIEARIQYLQNIKMMLDTTVIMMQQYNAAAALAMPMPKVSPNGDITNADIPSTSGTGQEDLNEVVAPSTPTKSQLNAGDSCTNEESSNLKAEEIPTASTSSNSTDSQLPMTKDEEIRKRRLERFQ